MRHVKKERKKIACEGRISQVLYMWSGCRKNSLYVRIENFVSVYQAIYSHHYLNNQIPIFPSTVHLYLHPHLRNPSFSEYGSKYFLFFICTVEEDEEGRRWVRVAKKP